MFTLWYTILGYKEYKAKNQRCLTCKRDGKESSGNSSNIVKNTSPQTPKSSPLKVPTSLPPPPPPPPLNKSPIGLQRPSHTHIPQPAPIRKPARSPSPHPIRSEAIDMPSEEESDEGSSEEEEEEEDDEEEEEDYDDDINEHSVIDSSALKTKKLLQDTITNDPRNSVKDFISIEKNSPHNQRKSNEMVDAAVLDKLESGFKKLEASDSKSLLKKYLTREVFDKLKTKKTSFGSTLLDVIQSGLENHDSGIGIYAPDAEAYTVFADLFDPIIEDYHGGFKKTDKHPPKNWGDVSVFGNLDPAGEFVVSTRVRCGRSLEGYPFNPCLTEEQYKEMEQKVSSTLSGLEGELKGTFYPLTGMSKEVQQKLIDDHFLFKEGDRFLQAANACRFWPTGRGIFHNDNKTFLVWVNEEDHLRIISMQMGGDLGQVYRRLVTAVNDIEKRLPFSHHDRLGFLTFCPTNLGTTVRASVHIKVPKLASNKAKLDEVASKFNLQVRGTRGEHTEAEGGIYDISNKRRMGLTEFDAVKEMYDGIAELIKIEKEL
ncbi:arginine kinase isoform X1 [Agrilus planipennis]|uniref:arginine kinase n=2 Tax=Agrilus planipennis TaxID=224129 RepID=A0A1W4WYG0_AGRPL|nr:arginine kinase isoform X1 [Agrilus planipennis]XP_018325552.1 arginine kinase isoform X1 [Agrilus planipennis]